MASSVTPADGAGIEFTATGTGPAVVIVDGAVRTVARLTIQRRSMTACLYTKRRPGCRAIAAHLNEQDLLRRVLMAEPPSSPGRRRGAKRSLRTCSPTACSGQVLLLPNPA
jgi:hypothetical protein